MAAHPSDNGMEDDENQTEERRVRGRHQSVLCRGHQELTSSTTNLKRQARKEAWKPETLPLTSLSRSAWVFVCPAAVARSDAGPIVRNETVFGVGRAGSK